MLSCLDIFPDVTLDQPYLDLVGNRGNRVVIFGLLDCSSCSFSCSCDIGKQSQLQLRPVQVELSSKLGWSLTI